MSFLFSYIEYFKNLFSNWTFMQSDITDFGLRTLFLNITDWQIIGYKLFAKGQVAQVGVQTGLNFQPARGIQVMFVMAGFSCVLRKRQNVPFSLETPCWNYRIMLNLKEWTIKSGWRNGYLFWGQSHIIFVSIFSKLGRGNKLKITQGKSCILNLM